MRRKEPAQIFKNRCGRYQAEGGFPQQVIGFGGKFGRTRIALRGNLICIIAMGDHPVRFPKIEKRLYGKARWVIKIALQIADSDRFGLRESLL